MNIAEGVVAALVFIFVLTVLFLVIVAPIWVIMHYLAKAKKAQGLSPEDRDEMMQLWKHAKSMEKRLKSLEEILDTESPSWRKKYETLSE